MAELYRVTDEIETYVLVNNDDTEMSEECDTPKACRNLLTSQEWEPEAVAAGLRVVRKVYTFDGTYEEVE